MSATQKLHFGFEERVRRGAETVSAASDGLVRQRDLARSLGVSDQRIATWRSRGAKNGFPEPVACSIGPHKGGGRRGAYLWRLEDVEAWFRDYDEAAQRSRKGPYWGSRSRQKG